MCRVGPLTIGLDLDPAAITILDELLAAIEESPEPSVVKRFLDDDFGLLGRLGELFRIEANPAVANQITVSLRKTDLYDALLLAIRTGDFEGLLSDVLLNVGHEESPVG